MFFLVFEARDLSIYCLGKACHTIEARCFGWTLGAIFVVCLLLADRQGSRCHDQVLFSLPFQDPDHRDIRRQWTLLLLASHEQLFLTLQP